jgi:hypothetical protein
MRNDCKSSVDSIKEVALGAGKHLEEQEEPNAAEAGRRLVTPAPELGGGHSDEWPEHRPIVMREAEGAWLP